DGGEKDSGRTCGAERRRMMLGDEVGVKALAVVHLRQAQTVLVMLCEGQVAAIDVVEDTELQDRSPLGFCFAHDLRANASRLSQGKPLHTFPGHARSSGSMPSISTKAMRQTLSERLTQA